MLARAWAFHVFAQTTHVLANAATSASRRTVDLNGDNMIRVLVVDDSATSRQLLRHILSADHELQVVGEAKDGAEAVKQTKSLRPHVVLMDIHMPVLDGLQATREIMFDVPTPIVLISASTMVHEVATAVESLAAGALTLLLKPSSPETAEFDRDCRILIETIKAMSDVKVIRRLRHMQTRSPIAPAVAPRSAPHVPQSSIGICAIATSTGGPPALQKILSGLPADFPVPILIVQHIAVGFTLGLLNWLKTVSPLAVKIASPGETLSDGTVYLAPENRHLGVTSRGTIILSDDPPIAGFRPSGTHLFCSVAESYRQRALAIILTGMGRDGVDGLRAIHKHGGTIFAQDEATSVVFGMPGAAIAEQLSDRVLPIDSFSAAILERCASRHK